LLWFALLFEGITTVLKAKNGWCRAMHWTVPRGCWRAVWLPVWLA